MTSSVPNPKMKIQRRMTHIGKATLTSEIDTNPSHPVGFMVIDGAFDFDQFCENVNERVLLNPSFERMRCRVMDKEFFVPVTVNIRDHIHKLSFDDLTKIDNRSSDKLPIEERKLAKFVSDLIMEPFARDRPLWDFYVINKYIDGKSVIVFKTHHCIGDGASLSIMFSNICDQTEVVTDMHRKFFSKNILNKKDQVPATPTSKPASSFEYVSSIFGDMFKAFMVFFYYFWGFLAFNFKYVSSFCFPELKTQLKNQLTGKRIIGWTQPCSVSEIKVIGKTFGGTVNDVLLSAIAGALRRYLIEEGKWNSKDLKALRVACPVNIRSDDDYDYDYILRNLFGFVITQSPIHVDDPVMRLRSIHKDMTAIKKSPEQTFSYYLAYLTACSGAAMQKLAMKVTTKYFSFVCTNVAGPPIPMEIGGKSILYSIAMVPPPNHIALGFAIWSSYGFLRVSASCDEGIDVNSWKLCQFIDEELNILQNLAKDKMNEVTLENNKKTN